MAVDHYKVQLTGSETYRLADMAGVHMDLRMTAATTAQLSCRNEQDQPDGLICQAMLDSALIRYGRCFKGGVRTEFAIPQAWIDHLQPDLRQAHRHFVALRDARTIAQAGSDQRNRESIVVMA